MLSATSTTEPPVTIGRRTSALGLRRRRFGWSVWGDVLNDRMRTVQWLDKSTQIHRGLSFDHICFELIWDNFVSFVSFPPFQTAIPLAIPARDFTAHHARWGRQEDDITLLGQLELVAPNILREAWRNAAVCKPCPRRAH